MLNTSTKKAMSIIKELLLGNEVSEYSNADLKKIYSYESEVSNEIDEILDMFGLDAYEGQEGELMISPRIDNLIFGYKNEELKKLLKVDTNLEIYLCYFIMSCVLVMFYKDTSGRAIREFLISEDLKDEVTLRLEVLKSNSEDSKVSIDEIEKQDGCLAIIDLWINKLPDIKLNSKAKDYEDDIKSKSKIAYCNRVLKFFESQKLMYCDTMTRRYTPSDRFKTVVINAYVNSNYNYIELLNRKIEASRNIDNDIDIDIDIDIYR